MTQDKTIGGRELCAWRVAPSVTWIQTRSPLYARKLSQRSDGRLVARGVAGGYLRTHEFPHGLVWARQLISRYTTPTVEATNERFLTPTLAQTGRKLPGGIKRREIAPKGFAPQNRATGVPTGAATLALN